MHTHPKKQALLRAEAKKILNLNSNEELDNIVKTINSSASEFLGISLVVSVVHNNSWGVSWIDPVLRRCFVKFQASDLALQPKEFIEKFLFRFRELSHARLYIVTNETKSNVQVLASKLPFTDWAITPSLDKEGTWDLHCTRNEDNILSLWRSFNNTPVDNANKIKCDWLLFAKGECYQVISRWFEVKLLINTNKLKLQMEATA